MPLPIAFPNVLRMAMEGAYFELDLAGNITFFNNATLTMLGYESSELTDMNYRRYVFLDTALEL